MPLSKELMEDFGLTLGATLDIVRSGGSFIVTPVKGVIDEKAFHEATDRVMKRYSKTLKDLS